MWQNWFLFHTAHNNNNINNNVSVLNIHHTHALYALKTFHVLILQQKQYLNIVYNAQYKNNGQI